MRIALTGVPGTGKTALANALGKGGFDIISLNELVVERKLWVRVDKFGSKVADIKKLQLETNKILKNRRNCVVEGHLACEMKLKCDVAVVCRTRPDILEKRLRKRGYPQEKLNENLMCELLDYCTIRSLSNYKNVYEIETGGSIGRNVARIMRVTTGRGERFRAGWVSWGKELLAAVG